MGGADGGGDAGRPTAGHQQVVAGLDRDFPHQPIGLLVPDRLGRRFGRGGLRRGYQGRRTHHARCTEGRGLQERSSIDLCHATTSLSWIRRGPTTYCTCRQPGIATSCASP